MSEQATNGNINIKSLAEGTIKDMFAQFVDMFVDHSRLAEQVKKLTEQMEEQSQLYRSLSEDLHRQIDDMRQALVRANAERDRAVEERDSARRDADHWQMLNARSEEALRVEKSRADNLQAEVESLTIALAQTKDASANWERQFNIINQDVERLNQERAALEERIKAARATLSDIVVTVAEVRDVA